MLCYYDSSILLAILLDQERKQDALHLWSSATHRVSSILLRLETITVLRRTWEHNRQKLEATWLSQKTAELQEYLCEIHVRIIDEDIEKIIFLKKEIAKCRTLDAIHIATAFEFSLMLPSTDFYVFSYDQEMLHLAGLFKFKTNDAAQEFVL